MQGSGETLFVAPFLLMNGYMYGTLSFQIHSYLPPNITKPVL
jgi:hypothetical protein